MHVWIPQLFTLKSSTAQAEGAFSALTISGACTTGLMTHDHAYLHIHALCKGVAQYKAMQRKQYMEWCEKQQKAAAEESLKAGRGECERNAVGVAGCSRVVTHIT